MSAIRLISTDFDGTLIGHPSDGRCVPALADALAEAKHGGAFWAVNTGRSLEHALEGLDIFAAPVSPDFLLTLEREIHEPDGRGGWRDLGDWNRICRERHEVLFDESSGVLAQLTDHFATFPDTTLIEEAGRLIGLVTASEAVMDLVTAEVAKFRAEFPDLAYQRNTIYLRFCHKDYDKGSALAELAWSLGIAPDGVFAAGDHFNDLPMLRPEVAACLGCPSNAIPEVKRAVENANGVVSKKPAGAGVAEALANFWKRGKEKAGGRFRETAGDGLDGRS